MRILIAEDQPELRRMLVKDRRHAGYTVDGVPHGAEARPSGTRQPTTWRCWTS